MHKQKCIFEAWVYIRHTKVLPLILIYSYNYDNMTLALIHSKIISIFKNRMEHLSLQ